MLLTYRLNQAYRQYVDSDKGLLEKSLKLLPFITFNSNILQVSKEI